MINIARRASQSVRSRASVICCALALATFCTSANAQTCGGFTDVSPGDFFCNNVEWIKNRAVTLGCGAGIFCPADYVTRGAMAAFMNRLGKALTPQPVNVTLTTGPLNLDGNPVVCASTAVAADNYARVMAGTWHLDAQSAGAMALQGRLVVSNDGGTTWVDLAAPMPMRAQTDVASWTAVGGAGTHDIAIGESPRFALRLARQAGGGAAQLADGHCQLSLKVMNRNPTTPPY